MAGSPAPRQARSVTPARSAGSTPLALFSYIRNFQVALATMPLLLEVIVQSVADARAAARGGADRLEVVRAIGDGGLTPSAALVRAIAAEVSLPLRVMVRENAGFSTNEQELPALRDAVATFAADGVDGVVLGFARGCEPAIDDTVRAL